MSVLVRCDDCGALLWSLLRAKPGSTSAGTCDICGGVLKLERRRPGRRFRRASGERRDFRAPKTPTARGA